MTIYIDSDYRCHKTNDGSYRAVETSLFDGKCDIFIEGYRYIPEGESWTGPKGIVYQGEAMFPFINYEYLVLAQEQYERDILRTVDMQNALNILGVTE